MQVSLRDECLYLCAHASEHQLSLDLARPQLGFKPSLVSFMIALHIYCTRQLFYIYASFTNSRMESTIAGVCAVRLNSRVCNIQSGTRSKTDVRV